MDTSDKEKANDQTSYNISGIHSDWQCNTPSLRPVCGTPPVYSTHQEDHLGAGACPSSSMVSSFSNCPWNTANATDLRLSESNVPLDSLSGGNFLQNGYDLSANLSADSSFIQRSAHFSGFHAGSFGAMMNPFSTTQLVNPCSSAASDLERARLHKSEVSMAEALKNEPFHTAGDPTEDQKKVSLHASVTMSNRSSEHDTTGGARQEAIDNSSPKELAAKKRKKTNADPVLNQVQGASQMASETTEAKKNVEPESSSAPTVNSNGKEIKEAPEAPKTDYIHIRARRGQATNSHSLAERLRREKISERMKFLQNLVPGCSKVTGKAVMLDEIINYVQSLQRQVEFLSMKLATVNPNLDINIETLLSKDLLQSRAGHPSGMSFPLDVIHPQLSLSQQGLAHPGTSGILNPSDLLLRSLNPQMTSLNGYKERAQQMPTSWDEEIRNVMQMSYDSNPTLNL